MLFIGTLITLYLNFQMLDIIGTCHWLCSVMRDSLRPCDSSPRGFSVHGILQARILERVAISSSREPSRPRDPAHDSCVSFIGSGFFTTEPGKHLSLEDKTNFLNPPGGASGKVSACQCRRPKRCREGKIPWRRKWQPTPVFRPGKSHPLSMGSQRVVTAEHTHTPDPRHKKAPVTGMCQTCAWPPELPCPGATLKLLPSCSLYTVARISLPVSS